MLAASLGGGAALVRIVALSYCRGELQQEADQTALDVGNALPEYVDGESARFAVSAGPIGDDSKITSQYSWAKITAERDGYNRMAEVIFESSLKFGQWDASRRQFCPSHEGVNAVMVSVRGSVGQPSREWLSGWFSPERVVARTTAVAALRPRDIVFVVDLSGAMTGETRAALEHLFHNAVEDPAYLEDKQLRRLYADLGFESYPGALESFGAPWNAGEGCKAYETLISEDGPLTDCEIDKRYRIELGDPISTRRRKAYRAVIEQQVASVMPEVRPSPSDPANFEYWAEYLDEVLSSDDPDARIGYASYLQFMLKRGRTIRAGGQHVALSQYSEDPAWCHELVEGGAFRCPPRTEPMHEVRRGLLTVLNDIAKRNRALISGGQRDRVAIITFDSLSPGGAWIEQAMTSDYGAACGKLARLQAVGERAEKATGLAALQLAEELLREHRTGGRDASQQVVVVAANRIQGEEGVSAQIAEMTRVGQSVRVISVGGVSDEIAVSLPVGDAVSPTWRELGRGYGVERNLREAVSSFSIALVK